MHYILQSITATGIQVIILLGPLIVLAIAMQAISTFVERLAYRLFGYNLCLWMFSWFGTAVHELGHAFFCVVFRHRITDMQLFRPDPTTGTLGYVIHNFDRNSAFQLIGNFFIGIGPVLFGSALIYLLHTVLIPMEPQGHSNNSGLFLDGFPSLHEFLIWTWESMSTAAQFMTNMLSQDNLIRWQFYLFLYLAFSIGSSITLSLSDIRGAASGLGAFVGTLLILNVFTLWTGTYLTDTVIYISKFLELIYAVLILTASLNVVFGIILLLITGSFKWRMQ